MPVERHRTNHYTDPPAVAPAAPRRLIEEILALSVAGCWAEARQEWALSVVYFTDSAGRCLCGHPITEHCLLVNHLNGNEAIVGNVCVNRFLDIPSGPIFAGLRRIARNIRAALNEAVIEYAYVRNWINHRERAFCLDTLRRPRLSARQRAWRVAINLRVLTLVGGVQHA